MTIEELAASLDTKLNGFKTELEKVSTRVQTFETQFPGMSKSHAAEAKKDLEKMLADLEGKLVKPKDEGKEKKPNEVEELQKKIDALIQENAKSREEKESETRKAEIARVLAKHKIVKGLEDYAHGDLLKLVTRDEKGNLVLTFKDKIGGIEVDAPLGIEDGVKRFLKEKPVFQQSDVSGGGSGASGGNSFPDGVKPTWAQLKANATLLREWSEKDPQYVNAAQTESLAKLTATKG